MDSGHRDYETLVRPVEDAMLRSIWRIVRDPDDADEAMQNALGTVWRRLGRIRRHPNPRALILRICVNASYDVLRRKIRRRRREELHTIPSEMADPAPSAADRLSSQEQCGEVISAIGQLPRRQAEAAFMKFVQELSYGDIAQALGCSEVTVRTHISRARVGLRERLAHLSPHVSKEAL